VNRRLLLVRHGVTTWNREGRFQGHLDPPLDDTGVIEARLLAERLAREEPERLRVVSSPLQRATATARLLADSLKAQDRPPDLSEDARLMEIGQGDWEGHTHVELAAWDPDRYAAWRADGGATQPPGAEPLEYAGRRVAAAIDELTSETATAVCVVSHGGILRLAAGHLLGLSLAHAWSLDVDNASLSRLSQSDGARWRLDAWNDTGHLLGRTPLHVDEAEGAPLAL
jgi:broad specificity phosphatase PhoE